MRQIRFSLVYFLVVASMVACGNNEDRASERMKKAQLFLEQNKIEKARVELKNVLQINPKSTDAWYSLGKLYEKKAQYNKAVQNFRKVIELDPTHVKATRDLGLIYLVAGEPDKAKELAAQAMLLDPDDPGVITFNGTIQLQLKNLEEAEKMAQKALEKDLGFVDASMLLATVYSQTNRMPQALETIKVASDKNAQHVGLKKILAQYYANDDKHDKAIDILNQIIEIQPDNFSHRMILASYYVTLKRSEDAQKVLEKSAEDMPEAIVPRMAYAKFLLEYRSKDQAKKILLQYVEQFPETYDYRFALAELEKSMGNNESAENVYKKIVKLDDLGPNGIKARNHLAIDLVKDNKIEKALVYIEEVIKENPRDIVALVLRGNIALSNKNAVLAINDYRAILRESPKSVDILKKLAAAHVINKEPQLAMDNLKKSIEINPEDAESQFQLGQLAAQKGDYQLAIEHTKKALVLKENYKPALETLFKAQFSLKQAVDARVTIGKLLEHYPDEALGNYFSALLYQQQGQFRKSIEAYKTALIKSPDAIEPLSGLVKLYIKQNNYQDAIRQLDKVLKSRPDNIVALNMKGEVLLSNKQYREADKLFNRVMLLNPKYIYSYINLAQSKWELEKDINSTIKIYQQGIEATNYNAPRLIYKQALLYEQIGKHDKALDLYQGLIDKDARALAAINNMAMLLATYKDDVQSHSKAKGLVQKLRDTENPAYLDTLGWVYYRNSEFDIALSYLKRAVEKLPNQPLLQYHLGMAYYTAGNNTKAEQNLQSAIASGRNFTGKTEAVQTLKLIDT